MRVLLFYPLLAPSLGLILLHRYPVLIAIDDYNLLHSHAVDLYDPDFQKLNPPLIRPEKMVLPSLFQKWQNHGLLNGTMVCAMSNTKPRNTKEFDAQFPKLPSVFSVTKYSKDEYLTVVANYEQNGYIHSTFIHQFFVDNNLFDVALTFASSSHHKRDLQVCLPHVCRPRRRDSQDVSIVLNGKCVAKFVSLLPSTTSVSRHSRCSGGSTVAHLSI